MCGIVGIVGRPPEDPEVIARMVSQLGHRGPDSSGLWRSDTAHLGHTRLSIIDLSAAGNQPMCDGPLVLTYNGEVYNFQALRRRLPGPFRSNTDSEVVLRAFREHRARCVDHLVGMFAFAIWDEHSGRLFAARDRLGIKPLYYRPLPGGLAFASELAPLLELGRPQLEPGAIYDYLTYGYIPTPKTPWQGIFKLPPAHHLVWDGESCQLERYWQPEPSCRVSDLEQALPQLEALLETVIQDHTVADVPVGVFLSSGVDSAALAAFVAGRRTFTMSQADAHRDEAPAARLLAEHLGSQHQECAAAVPDLDRAIDQVVEIFDEPFSDSGGLAVCLLSRFVVQHVKVALSGEGGDEIFCGYRWYGPAMSQRSLLAHRLGARLLPPVSRLGRSCERRSLEGLERYAAFLGVFTPRQRQALAGPRLDQPVASVDPLWYFRRYWRPELPAHQRLQWLDLHTYLPDCLLTKVDRASMASSLEVRPPLLDHRMVELALTLDVGLQRDAGNRRGKVLLRRLLEPRLPPGHLERPKRGFNLPIARWVRREPQILDQALRRLEQDGWIRRRRMVGLTNEQTWALLVLDRWLARYASG